MVRREVIIYIIPEGNPFPGYFSGYEEAIKLYDVLL